MPTELGRVVQLFRYPVKSMRGESLGSVDVTERGLLGDRNFGIVDEVRGRLLSAKTVPQLLEARALLRPDGEAELTLPGRPPFMTDDSDASRRLSSWLGRDVAVVRPAANAESTIDIELDLRARGGGENDLMTFRTRPGMFFDGAPMNILTTASLLTMARRAPSSNWLMERFRPNILIEAGTAEDPTDEFPEDAWVGSTMTIGGISLEILKRCDRCPLVNRAVASAPADRDLLRALHREHGGDLGAKAAIVQSGRVRVGDPVTVV